MRVAMDAVLESGQILEGTICYTGDLQDRAPSKYDLASYLSMARDLQSAGTHILGLKDMAGLMKPEAARLLVRALKDKTGLPVHLHTHDTSGLGTATLLAAAEAGVDAVDCAMVPSPAAPASRPWAPLSPRFRALRATPDWAARPCAKSQTIGRPCERAMPRSTQV